MADQELDLQADQLSNAPLPEQSAHLFGHQGQLEQLLHAYDSHKLHHAFLIAGPKGIGKATFAYHVAQQLFAKSGDEPLERIQDQIRQGSFPNLKVIRRQKNPKTGKFAAQISVNDVRQAVKFFQTSAARTGVRICIVDCVDDLNANAANALLKTLEEPPQNAIFLLVTHRVGGVLPTIRSRCNLLPLKPVSDEDVRGVVETAGLHLGADEFTQILTIAKGRPRKAFEALEVADNPALSALFAWLEAPDQHSETAMLELAAALADPKAEQVWQLAIEMIDNHVAAIAKYLSAQEAPRALLAKALSVWEKTQELVVEQAIFNLDKKQTITMVLEHIRMLNQAAMMNEHQTV
ncbi:DNA-directed DNA polymerase [Maritalea myrionectae]|uniref:DNA-directed DNA polymerase n=1 Tax=Maritalea myrionectae TaxID=454601 RepID=A0A2R4MFC3_9HYPH|nr:AAA family ATPase [Maritalea myrionectae]AVX04645.1 DNA-directed DNA polymerase [Maritalea myrionectae]